MYRWLVALTAISSLCCMAGTSPTSCSASAGDLVTVETAADNAPGTVWLVQMTSKAKRPETTAPASQVMNNESNARSLHEEFAFDQTGMLASELSQKPLLMQAGSNSTAGRTTKLDTTDASVMFYAMVLMIILYFLLGGWMLNGGKDESVTWESSLRNVYSRARWPIPSPDVLEQVLPAISGFMVGQSADLPLLIPLKGLEERTKQMKSMGGWFASWFSSKASKVAWTLDIKSNKKTTVFTVRQMKYADDSLGHLEVVASYGGRPDACLARIDSKLMLYKEDGTEFGKLVKKQSGAYELAEHATGRHRWLVTPTLETEGLESFTFTWRPRRNVIASVTRGHHQHAGFMKVMMAKGVDAVLVTLCVIGLFVFRIDCEHGHSPPKSTDKTSASPRAESPEPGSKSTDRTQASPRVGSDTGQGWTEGFAGSLLQQPVRNPGQTPAGKSSVASLFQC
eukprot:TRINITY_DN102229_c0_g1_i1.p1 TRINITY_DN102229_c0_g1~~TRINITY_DN102229_c0_g1_i1.p1  ORF type:complete len:453 (+),score=63.67 TRINITY_DN102229_c0_g1_i1:78-1436(+)